MDLKKPFIKLPISKDASMALEEVFQHIDGSEWIDHPNNFPGNTYLPLTSYNGTANNLKKTPVSPTIYLNRLPTIKKLLKSFGFRIGISRLMKLDAGYEVPVHADTNEYWDKRLRIHVPLISSKKVFFACGNDEVVMTPGEVWTFNNWFRHGVRNEGIIDRIHLVFDTEISNILNKDGTVRDELSDTIETETLILEKQSNPPIKSGIELAQSLSILVKELQFFEGHEKKEAEAWLNLIKSIQLNWNTIENEYGVNAMALSSYQNVIKNALNEADELGEALRLKTNNVKVIRIFNARVKDAINLQILFSNEK